ncbi:MAG: hypothetical protein ACRC5A_13470 [Enterobacteriaceae bacterium]
MGQQVNKGSGHTFFCQDILTFPYKSPELSDKISHLQKGDKLIVPVTLRPKEIGLLCIECAGEGKVAEMTVFDSTQYSIEMVRSLYEEVFSGLKIPQEHLNTLKIFHPAFKGAAGHHHDGAVHVILIMNYLRQNAMTARRAYHEYAHEIKQYEHEAQKMKKLAMTAEELHAAGEHVARQVRSAYTRLIATV